MIRQKIQELIGHPEAQIERPESEKFGDYSTSVALKLAKKEGRNPIEFAQEMAQKIKNPMLAKVEAVAPGFVNFTLSEEFLNGQVKEILKAGKKYGQSALGGSALGGKIQVEFISANPTGPLTLGNGRGGFFGDVLANVLTAAGYSVKREYLINDAGFQVEVLGHSVLKDERAQYKGEHIDKLNKKLVCWLCSKDPKKIGQKAARYILKNLIKPTISERMKIKFDVWISEQKIKKSGRPEKILKTLREKNLIYEQDGATWFKSTEFGDDKDRVLITSAKDGRGQAETYLLPDIAYHHKKFAEDKFDKVINVWGADHHGYVARLQAAGKALGEWDEQKLKIIIMQLVRLFENGQEVKMSKRAGTYITLDELLDEIPLDVARWFFLTRSADTHMDFNLDLAKEQSDKNPVYYAQYAYARICSILRKTSEGGSPPLGGVRGDVEFNYSIAQPLNHPAELGLIKQLIRLPEIVEDTAKDYQVHRLPQYALDLVRAFHKFYEKCKVLDENDKEKTQVRLGLVEATKIILANTLTLMGISAPEKM
ncbi:MAG: arginine--tRNA ligase [Candidatus Portnoybacteria bacterium]|nr:arginine--tRNA ligase [Candidatus Portnoybacteria bacterium]